MGTDVTDGAGSRAAGEPREKLAPVIPLFGDRSGAESRAARTASPRFGEPEGGPDDEMSADDDTGAVDGAGAVAEAVWRSTWDDDVVPLRASTSALSGATDTTDATDDDGTPAGIELAEKQLLKKLRGRSLSVSEARGVLLASGAAPADADRIIDAFVGRGYLDDAAFAEQLVHVGLDRKGQGRRVIAQTLAKRGIPRDVADAALLALPDDDTERALDFARAKARSLASLDRDTALRRLTGQLARRGYGGSVALDAARTALDELSPRGPFFR